MNAGSFWPLWWVGSQRKPGCWLSGALCTRFITKVPGLRWSCAVHDGASYSALRTSESTAGSSGKEGGHTGGRWGLVPVGGWPSRQEGGGEAEWFDDTGEQRIVKSEEVGYYGWGLGLGGKRKGVQAHQCFVPVVGSLRDQQGTPGACGGMMRWVRPVYHKGPPPHPTQE